MRWSHFALTVIPLLANCSQGHAASETASINDECDATSSNIEFTECWQRRASRARLEADNVFARAQESAGRSDERESGGAPAEYKTWLSDALGDSQSSWISSMEQQCLLEGRVARGGTGTRAIVARCPYRMSNHRTDELGDVIASMESF